MSIDPLLVHELRELFKTGATPSAIIRVVAERHAGEPQIDRLVRAYFREAFLVPMLQVGREQVEGIARGGAAAALNSLYVHRMVATRNEWDRPPSEDETVQPTWLDSLAATDEVEMLRTTEASALPELTGCWDQIGEEGRHYVTRVVANARSLYETVQALAALAERLQQQVLASARAGANPREACPRPAPA